MLRGSMANNSLINSNVMSMESGDFIRRVDDLSDLGASGVQQVKLEDSQATELEVKSEDINNLEVQ